MGKAAAFVCVIAFGIILITSGDRGGEIDLTISNEDEITEASLTNVSTSIEGNVSQNTAVQNYNTSSGEVDSTKNDEDEITEASLTNVSTSIEEKVSQNTAVQNYNTSTDGGESSSNTKPKGTKGRKNRKERKRKKSNKDKQSKPQDNDENYEGKVSERLITSQEEDSVKSNPVCEAPPDIEGAISPEVEGTEHPLETTVSYSCPLGYVSRNSLNHISVCRINRETGRPEWTVPTISCSPQSCGDPGYLNNGYRKGNLFTFPNKVEYECEEGYKLRGIKDRYCQAGGDWSGKLPTCEKIFCSVPADPVNGQVKYSSLEYGTELTYQCKVGYILKKHQPRICSEDGRWSNGEPECIEATCEEPQPPKYGSVKLHGDLKVGSLATYSCDPDRKLHGATTTKCLRSGTWTFEAPECLSSCTVPFIENGEMGKREIRYTRGGYEFKRVSTGQKIDSRHTLFLQCENGASLVVGSEVITGDSLEVTCNDGTWSNDLQCRKTHCLGQPPPSRNAEPVIGSRQHGFTIYYRCTRTNTLKIAGNVTCHLGTWIGIPPRCLNRPCYTWNLNYPGLLKPPEEYFDSSESFEINCEKGYRKTSRDEKITCNRGRWETSQNPCTSETEDSRINPTTEGLQISREEFKPSTNMVSSSPRTTDVTRNPECVCTYEYDDPVLKVQIGNKILNQRGTVKLGETVSLECTHNYKRMKWMRNGMVFSGKPYMTCSTCRKWQREDFPICIPSTSDTYITYDGYFKISPGGIVDIRKGDSHRFKCKSIYGPPTWDIGGRPSVHVNTYELRAQRHVSYVSHLDIIGATNRHNGRYECFLFDSYLNRVGSTFFYLNVQDGEDRSVSTVEPSGSRVTQPSVNVESSKHTTTDAKHNEDCFCTYENEDENVKAQIGHKVLVVGDTIRRGEIVSFECKFIGMVLIWQNGLRLIRKANMTCNTCKIWQKNDVPICKNYVTSDSIITFNDDINLLPGGIAVVQKGEINQFSCSNNINYPKWDYGQRKDVNVVKTNFTGNDIVYYVSTLKIDKQEDERSGVYECYLNDDQGQRIGSTFLHLQVPEADIACPEIDRSGIFTLRFSNGRRINSTVTFYCKDGGKRIEGHSCLICLPNGTWSGRFPKCVDYNSCPDLSHTPGLNVTYSNDLSVGSIASFKCSNATKFLNGRNSSVCQENGSWSSSLPSCEDSKCSIHDLTMSLSESIVPDMSNVFGENVTLGFEVKLICNNKSVITGNSKAQCEKQGKWKLGTFQCVPGCVLNIDPSSHLLIDPKKDSYRIGDLISLSCPPGDKMSSEVEKIMCFGGKWSDTLPECTPLERKPSI